MDYFNLTDWVPIIQRTHLKHLFKTFAKEVHFLIILIIIIEFLNVEIYTTHG